MAVFDRAAGGSTIKAFVNVGGSWVNMGTDADVLKLSPGLNRDMAVPPAERRGVIQEMALRGIPVIHLLYVKGLADRFGLPWDPFPLPEAEDGGHGRSAGTRGHVRLIVLGVYLAGLLAAAVVWMRFGELQPRRRASI